MASPPAPASHVGRVGWHELHAAQWQAALAFYSEQFGWTEADAVDMGAMGIYQLFAADGVPCGGMMTKAEAVPAPYWLFYFNVADINAAAARVASQRGQVLNGPHEVPGGSLIVQCRDPQGAMFALVQPPA
jgi:predicted enzyme related to lactoylglutathione lyase